MYVFLRYSSSSAEEKEEEKKGIPTFLPYRRAEVENHWYNIFGNVAWLPPRPMPTTVMILAYLLFLFLLLWMMHRPRYHSSGF
jgi:hypothetical protein